MKIELQENLIESFKNQPVQLKDDEKIAEIERLKKTIENLNKIHEDQSKEDKRTIEGLVREISNLKKSLNKGE